MHHAESTKWRGAAVGVCLAVTVGMLPLALVNATEPSPEQQAFLDRLQALNMTSGPDSVATLVGQKLPAARAAGDSVFVMRLVGTRGGSYTWHQRGREGAIDLQEAARFATALRDSATLGRSLNWLARALEDQGRQRESAATYRRLAAVGRGLGDPFLEGRGLIGSAWDRFLQGDYAAAESLYTLGGERSTAAADTFSVLWSRNGVGLCLWNTNRLDDAAVVFAHTRREARRTGMSFIEAAALNNHAGVMEVLGRPAEALRGYQAALAIKRRLIQTRETIPPALNVGRCLRNLGRLDDAAAVFGEVIEQCHRDHHEDFIPAAIEELAYVSIDQKRPAHAARLCREVLHGSVDIQPRDLTMLLVALAGAQTALDSLSAALATIERADVAADSLHDVQIWCEVALIKGRILQARGDHAAAAAVFMRAADATAQAGLLTRSLTLRGATGEALVAAGRTSEGQDHLLQALQLWETARVLPDDPLWRERRSASARRMLESLADVMLNGPDRQSASRRHRDLFDQFQRYKARTLLERTLGPGRELRTSATITLDSLQAAVLHPGELFVDVYVGERRSLLFAVTPDTLVVLPVRGRDSVRHAVDLIEASLQISDLTTPLDPNTTASALVDTTRDGTIARAVWSLVGQASEVVWSPDDALHQVPLVALFPADPTRFITRVPSATFLASLRQHPPRLASSAPSLLATAGVADGDGRPLVGAQREVSWLARTFRNVDVVEPGVAVSRPFGGRNPAAYQVLHIAAHTEIDPQRPWNSALVFGQPQSPVRLRAGDVANLALDARLAVLTGCTSAGAAILDGEGMLGLASGFLSAGVPAVLATLWSVDDQHAARFCQRFYRELAAGRTAAAALSRTQAWIRAQRTTSHPFHWAGYVLVGEGSQRVPLVSRRTHGPYATAIGAAVIGVMVCVLVWRRASRRRHLG